MQWCFLNKQCNSRNILFNNNNRKDNRNHRRESKTSIFFFFILLKKNMPIHHFNIKRAPSKAERRAEHNAIERARRESLNTKFQQLAHSLPNLQNDRRPSKGTIIERTLEYGKITNSFYLSRLTDNYLSETNNSKGRTIP